MSVHNADHRLLPPDALSKVIWVKLFENVPFFILCTSLVDLDLVVEFVDVLRGKEMQRHLPRATSYHDW